MSPFLRPLLATAGGVHVTYFSALLCHYSCFQSVFRCRCSDHQLESLFVSDDEKSGAFVDSLKSAYDEPPHEIPAIKVDILYPYTFLHVPIHL